MDGHVNVKFRNILLCDHRMMSDSCHFVTLIVCSQSDFAVSDSTV